MVRLLCVQGCLLLVFVFTPLTVVGATPVVDSPSLSSQHLSAQVDTVGAKPSVSATGSLHGSDEPRDIASAPAVHSAPATLVNASLAPSRPAARGPMSIALLVIALLGSAALTQRRSAWAAGKHR